LQQIFPGAARARTGMSRKRTVTEAASACFERFALEGEVQIDARVLPCTD